MDPNPPDFVGTDVSGADFSGAFGVIFAIVIIAIVVSIILAIVRGARVLDAGHNPLTLETDLALKALDSNALAPTASIEDRLAHLDDLLANGTISKSEHATARAAVLAAG
jgi:hypothetical protein